MVDGGAYEPLGAGLTDGLEAEPGIGPYAPAELRFAEVDQFSGFLGVRLEFKPGIDIFGVLPEDDHVDLFRRDDRAGHGLEVADGAHAGEEVEPLAQGDIEAAVAAADGRRQRALDGDAVLANGVERFVGQIGTGHVVGLVAGEDLHPGDLAFAAVDMLDRRVEEILRGAPDVGPGAVAFDEPDDGPVRRLYFPAGAQCYLLAFRHLNVLKIAHAVFLLSQNPERPAPVAGGQAVTSRLFCRVIRAA